jgi:hypothetical protein
MKMNIMKSALLLPVLICMLIANASFSQANTTMKSKSFIMPGTYHFIVPAGITNLSVSLSGSGGWGGGNNRNMQGSGGNGGLVSGNMTVKEGEDLIIFVGGGGAPGKAAAITAIMRDKDYIAIAAGGGNGSGFGGKGGNAGPMGMAGTRGTGTFNSGNAGTGASLTNGGGGGTAGASGSSGTAGIALKGGTNNARATGEGWGAAGWFGGGAAATFNSPFVSAGPHGSGGGGGGSNYIKGLTGNIVNGSNTNSGGIRGNMGLNGKVDLSWK